MGDWSALPVKITKWELKQYCAAITANCSGTGVLWLGESGNLRPDYNKNRLQNPRQDTLLLYIEKAYHTAGKKSMEAQAETESTAL